MGALADIDQIKAIIANLTTQVNFIEQLLANTSTDSNPTVDLGNGPVPISNVVAELFTNLNELRASYGFPADMFSALNNQFLCGTDNSASSLANPGVPLNASAGWNNNVINLADSIGNLWLVICDLRNAVDNIQTNLIPAGSASLIVELDATFDGDDFILLFTGSNPNGFIDCTLAGALITVKEVNGTASVSRTATILSVLGGPAEVINKGSLSAFSNYIVTVNACFTDGTSTVDRIITDTIINNTNCPTLTISPVASSISVAFVNTISGNTNYTLELYDQSGDTLLQSFSDINSNELDSIEKTFTGLSAGTFYLVRVGIQKGLNPVVFCPPQSVKTTGGTFWVWGTNSESYIVWNDEGDRLLLD